MLIKRNVDNFEDGVDRGNLSPLVSRETLNFPTIEYRRFIVNFITFDVDWSSKLVAINGFESERTGQADQAASGRCGRVVGLFNNSLQSMEHSSKQRSSAEQRSTKHNDDVYHWENYR